MQIHWIQSAWMKLMTWGWVSGHLLSKSYWAHNSVQPHAGYWRWVSTIEFLHREALKSASPAPLFQVSWVGQRIFALVGRMWESGRRKLEAGFAYKQADGVNLTSVKSLSCVRLFAIPWTAACQAYLSIPNSQSLFKLMSIESDAIQPSHPLSSPSPAFNLSQHQGLFQWVSSSHLVAKWLEFQWIFRTDFPYDGLIGSPCSPSYLKSLLQHHSLKASVLQCSVFFIVKLSHPYITTGKKHSFD